MSDTNGRTAPSTNGAAKKKATRNPTRNYQGAGTAWWGFPSAAIDGAPFFTWFDIPRMLRDPRVRLAERMWRAPFQRVKFKVRAQNPAVARFVGVTLRKLWRKSLPKLLSRYFRYGFAPAGAEFCEADGRLRLDRVTSVEPRDAQPRVFAAGPHYGRPAGFTLAPGGGLGLAGGGDVWVGSPHAVWFAGYGEFGQFYDLPPMSGMFEPWVEKRGRNGAVHSRRLWYRKCAFRGGVLYHPDEVLPGPHDDPGAPINGQDVARSTLEYAESGSVYTFVNEPNKADQTKYAWDFREPTASPDVKGVLEYPQHLDGEMLEGIGIPPEVLEAADVGSGWSGRMIPLMAFLGGVDELAGLLVESFDGPIRFAAGVNFGRAAAGFEIEPQSLAEEVQQQAKSGKGGGEGDNPIPGLLGMMGRDPSRQPTTRPTGGTLMSDDRSPIPEGIADRVRSLARHRKRDLVQLVAIAMLKAQERASARGKPEQAGAYLDQLAALASDPARLAEVTGESRSMSWTAYTGARGGHGWKNTETGRIVYQESKPGEKREKAQASGQKAREILTKVTRFEATPDDLAELADHLPALPVARLRSARQLLGASWGGSKLRREGMVGKLLEHVRGRIEHERTHGPAKDTRPEREGLPANWKDAEKPKKPAPAKSSGPPPASPPPAAPAKKPHEMTPDEVKAELGKAQARLDAARGPLNKLMSASLTGKEHGFTVAQQTAVMSEHDAALNRRNELMKEHSRRFVHPVAQKPAAAFLAESKAKADAGDSFEWEADSEEKYRALHRKIVEREVAAGKPVPSEVLADYPDLAAKHGKPADAGRGAAEPAGLTPPHDPAAGLTAKLAARHRGTKSSETNALMREAAALTPEQAAAVVKAMGVEPDKDARRQLVESIADRQATKLRSGRIFRKDHPQSQEIAALNDEPLLTTEQALAVKPPASPPPGLTADRESRIRKLGDLRGAADGYGTPPTGYDRNDPLGHLKAGFPAGLDRAAFRADVQKAADDHLATTRAPGIRYDELYRELVAKYRLTKADFARAMSHLHAAGDVRATDWHTDLSVIPDPELATMERGDVLYHVAAVRRPD